MAEEEERCALCMETKRSPVSVRCGHSFCGECLATQKSYYQYAWALRCPLCRAPFAEETEASQMFGSGPLVIDPFDLDPNQPQGQNRVLDDYYYYSQSESEAEEVDLFVNDGLHTRWTFMQIATNPPVIDDSVPRVIYEEIVPDEQLIADVRSPVQQFEQEIQIDAIEEQIIPNVHTDEQLLDEQTQIEVGIQVEIEMNVEQIMEMEPTD